MVMSAIHNFKSSIVKEQTHQETNSGNNNKI